MISVAFIVSRLQILGGFLPELGPALGGAFS
jgi:hypothetical protein